MTVLEKFKKICHKYLVLYNDEYLDVIFGAVLANQLDSTPVWLYLVGAPSSGKTEILQALSGPTIERVSKITAHTLNSAWKEEGKKQKDNSLLPKLNGKVMVIKDFTALIHSRSDTLMDIVGQLRDAYDGASRQIFGTGKDTEYSSKFGIIAAVTNVIDKHRGTLAELGERFLTYRCPDITEEESHKRCWKVSSVHSVRDQKKAMCLAALEVLKQPVRKVIVSDSFRNKVIDIASYIAIARCEITRDPYTKEPEIPTPEIATRLTRQLCDLAVGIAVVRGLRYISKDIQRLIQKIALDALTLKRLRTLHILYAAFPGHLSVTQIAGRIRFSEGIVRRWLEDLFLLDLIDRTASIDFPGKYLYRIKHKSLLTQIWKK